MLWLLSVLLVTITTPCLSGWNNVKQVIQNVEHSTKIVTNVALAMNNNFP